MAFQRLLVLALFATVLTAVLADTKSDKDVIIGSTRPGDYLLNREYVEKESKILQVVKLKRTFAVTSNARISQIKLLDQNLKGNGATAVVIDGGIGSSHVTVEFKSKRGHSIKYIVELYGR